MLRLLILAFLFTTSLFSPMRVERCRSLSESAPGLILLCPDAPAGHADVVEFGGVQQDASPSFEFDLLPALPLLSLFAAVLLLRRDTIHLPRQTPPPRPVLFA